jgi:hypothetical protein
MVEANKRAIDQGCRGAELRDPLEPVRVGTDAEAVSSEQLPHLVARKDAACRFVPPRADPIPEDSTHPIGLVARGQ